MRTQLAADVDMFAFADLYRSSLTIDGQPDTVFAQTVSGNYFNVLGITPAAGRLLTTADDRPGAPAAAVIGFDLWQRRFGGDPDAVGRLIVLNGVSFTVAGVLPRGFDGTMQVGQICDVMVPISSYMAVTRSEDDVANPNFWWVLMMGRLKPGVTRGTRADWRRTSSSRARSAPHDPIPPRPICPRVLGRGRFAWPDREPERHGPTAPDDGCGGDGHAARRLRECRQPACWRGAGLALGRWLSAPRSARRARDSSASC